MLQRIVCFLIYARIWKSVSRCLIPSQSTACQLNTIRTKGFLLRKKPERGQEAFLQVLFEGCWISPKSTVTSDNVCNKIKYTRGHKVFFSFENMYTQVGQKTQETGSVARLWFGARFCGAVSCSESINC